MEKIVSGKVKVVPIIFQIFDFSDSRRTIVEYSNLALTTTPNHFETSKRPKSLWKPLHFSAHWCQIFHRIDSKCFRIQCDFISTKKVVYRNSRGDSMTSKGNLDCSSTFPFEEISFQVKNDLNVICWQFRLCVPLSRAPSPMLHTCSSTQLIEWTKKKNWVNSHLRHSSFEMSISFDVQSEWFLLFVHNAIVGVVCLTFFSQFGL